MILPSIVFIICSFIVVCLVRFFLKGLEQEIVSSWKESRREVSEMQRDFNVQVRGLAENFTKHSVELQAQHLAHLKELELKMLSGGAKEYVDAQALHSTDPNLVGGSKKDKVDDWVELSPQPFSPPVGIRFGIEDVDGKVELMGEKLTKKDKKKGKK